MIVAIPTKVKEKFICLCHEAFHQPSRELFELFTRKAAGYSQAIKDIFGIEAWGEIVREADLSFPERVDTCAGIPLYRKNEVV